MNARTCIMLGMTAVAPLAAVAQNWGMASFEEEDSFFDNYIKGRLHIGLSYAKMSMDETSTPHEKAYLGNLDTLREDDMGQVGLTIKYDFCQYFAIMFADDMHAKVSVWNWGDEGSDGSLILDGYTIQAIGQYPFEAVENEIVLIPYLGLGFSPISASWSYASWWHYGWSSPENYDEYGEGSRELHNGYSRWMILKDPSTAFTFSLGLTVQIYSHFDIDFFYRAVDLDDVQAKFHIWAPDGEILREGAFPAKFSAYGVALRYVF